MLAQQRVPLSRELRVAVIGGRVTLCYELHQAYENSGLPTALVRYERRPAELTDALRDLAVRTAANLELEVALLDIADTGAGLVVIEANGSIAAWRDVHQVCPFDTTKEGIGDCYANYLSDLAIVKGAQPGPDGSRADGNTDACLLSRAALS